jgi:hypothetical protein
MVTNRLEAMMARATSRGDLWLLVVRMARVTRGGE